MTDITYHLADVRDRIRNALIDAHRDVDAVTLVAVSKQQTAIAIEAAFRAGQRHFGESYAQEALAKLPLLRDLPIEWHFIGRIQSNKTRPIAEHFAWVHTVDRLRIALRLNEQRPHHAPPLNVFLQVSYDTAPGRAGAGEAAVAALARQIAGLPRLRLRGLMSIPPAGLDPADIGAFYRRLHALGTGLSRDGIACTELSMGMSGDFEIAIAEGSTCVRIGTLIFGPRPG